MNYIDKNFIKWDFPEIRGTFKILNFSSGVRCEKKFDGELTLAGLLDGDTLLYNKQKFKLFPSPLCIS